MDVSNTPWSSFSQADYYDEQCQRATILDHQAGITPKERYGFPVREPDGTLNGRGVHAAAGRSSGVSPEAASVSRARSSPDTTTVLADRYQRKRVDSPNDGVCRWDGTAFFTDPSFGLPAEDPKRELPCDGVFATHNGKLVLVSDGLAGPNGLALAPDERCLCVANREAGRSVILRYQVANAEIAGPGKLVIDLSDQPSHYPTNPERKASHGHHHHHRRHADLLQGLGLGAADRIQSRLAAVR